MECRRNCSHCSCPVECQRADWTCSDWRKQSFVRPATETANPPTGAAEPVTGTAAIDAAIGITATGITASNDTGNTMPTGQPSVPSASNEPNAGLNAVP